MVPKSFYTPAVDPTIQWAKVACCPDCNDEFQKDEAHFKAILTLAGPTLTSERVALWNGVKRSFSNPVSGVGDRRAIANELVPVIHDGRLRFKVYPGKDERVVRIVKKIVRGLCVYKQIFQPPVLEERVWAQVMTTPIPSEVENDFHSVYQVPNLVLCRADFRTLHVHSAWIVRLLNVPFIALIRK